MDKVIIVGILGLLVPFAVFALRAYTTKPLQVNGVVSDTERLETIVSAILDRSISFDEQRKTVKELALSYREELHDREKEKVQSNVIQFFDHHSIQDKIRKN
jgi:hypothetical protein